MKKQQDPGSSKPRRQQALAKSDDKHQNREDILIQAKKTVMDRLSLAEPEAHRYIQKCAMDSGTGITEVCEMLILLYGD